MENYRIPKQCLELDPFDLPSIRYSAKHLLPILDCIYFVLTLDDERIHYIGQAKSLRHRFSNHNKHSCFMELLNPRVAYWPITQDQRIKYVYENSLILLHDPDLNTMVEIPDEIVKTDQEYQDRLFSAGLLF